MIEQLAWIFYDDAFREILCLDFFGYRIGCMWYRLPYISNTINISIVRGTLGNSTKIQCSTLEAQALKLPILFIGFYPSIIYSYSSLPFLLFVVVVVVV